MPGSKKDWSKTNRNAEICALRERGLTYTEIGKRYNMTRSNAECIVNNARELKERKEAAHLRTEDKRLEDMPLADFLLLNDATIRLMDGLFRCEEYQTVGDVIQETEKEMLKIPNMGKVSINELQTILRKHRRSLATAV